jgi:hypothetical protein
LGSACQHGAGFARRLVSKKHKAEVLTSEGRRPERAEMLTSLRSRRAD